VDRARYYRTFRDRQIIGIDGEIELVEDRAATAKIIKVQVKSGPSYFRKEDQRSFELHTSIDRVHECLICSLETERFH
jgi:hypothetical protein